MPHRRRPVIGHDQRAALQAVGEVGSKGGLPADEHDHVRPRTRREGLSGRSEGITAGHAAASAFGPLVSAKAQVRESCITLITLRLMNSYARSPIEVTDQSGICVMAGTPGKHGNPSHGAPSERAIRQRKETIVNNRIITDDAGLRCPACSRPAFYLHFGDRFAHADGLPTGSVGRASLGATTTWASPSRTRGCSRAPAGGSTWPPAADSGSCSTALECAPGGTSSSKRARRPRICAQCPALAACGEWLGRCRARRRPKGVVAGRLIACKF